MCVCVCVCVVIVVVIVVDIISLNLSISNENSFGQKIKGEIRGWEKEHYANFYIQREKQPKSRE